MPPRRPISHLRHCPRPQNLFPVTATVSAGVLATTLLIPLVPLKAITGPDFVASVVATAPGKTGSIKPKAHVKITNIGSSMTSATSLQIELVASTDDGLDSIDQLLLITTTPPLLLKAKQSKIFNLTGATTTSLTKGNYFILASVDSANAVAETDETNNVAPSTKIVALAPPIADLTAKFVGLPKKASISKLLPVTLSIQNLGTIPATGTIDVDFVASTDQTLDNSDISLGTGFPVIAHIAPGASQSARFKLSISSLPAGTYYLVAKVNSTSSISKSDLTNNDIFSTTLISIT